MPRELVALAPRTPGLREYKEPALTARQVHVRTEFASPKHGTGLMAYRGLQRTLHWRYDPEWGCLVPRKQAQVARAFPRRLGNMAVGRVTEVGSQVTRFRQGDRVFGHLPIRETHTVDEGVIDLLPEALSAEAAVCFDPAVMALAMHDAGIRLGDLVAVFGLGAIGLMAVQMARLAGADRVIAVDPIAARCDLALRYGADQALLPGDDGGLAVRLATRPAGESERQADTGGSPSRRLAGQPSTHVLGGYREAPTQLGQLGVDVAVEASGNTHGLQDAIRATRFGGTIAVLSYYPGEATGLRLGEEFHVNRLQLISCRAESLPLRDAPGWTLARMAQTVLRWLAHGRLRVDGMISPIVPFEQVAEAYRQTDEHPESCIKLGVQFAP